jgi:hypothetical protein
MSDCSAADVLVCRWVAACNDGELGGLPGAESEGQARMKILCRLQRRIVPDALG